mmetsp:Transcript_22269/g.26795  ORF Transcript_22269/g.26795 Transcript_22269/m.26795 type:complete len:206 (-) Transcript_22269:664-1281(-)
MAPEPSIVTVIDTTSAVLMSTIALASFPVTGNGIDAIRSPLISKSSIVPAPSFSGSVVPAMVRSSTVRPVGPAALKSKRKTPPRLLPSGSLASRSSEIINTLPSSEMSSKLPSPPVGLVVSNIIARLLEISSTLPPEPSETNRLPVTGISKPFTVKVSTILPGEKSSNVIVSLKKHKNVGSGTGGKVFGSVMICSGVGCNVGSGV